MSGAWAREADAQETWDPGLDRAALALALALRGGSIGGDVARHLRIASAIIRRERKASAALAPRLPDFPQDFSDERLTWVALLLVTETGAYDLTPTQYAYRLREAEAALRTLHKRGRS